MSQYISAELRQKIIERAKGCCEYCLIHQDDTPFSHQIDHIIAVQHGGSSEPENLALACLDCNKYKGPNLSSIDPIKGEVTTLFDPRNENWLDHFDLQGSVITGLTPCGRATIFLLRLNDSLRLVQREVLISVNRYPK